MGRIKEAQKQVAVPQSKRVTCCDLRVNEYAALAKGSHRRILDPSFWYFCDIWSSFAVVLQEKPRLWLGVRGGAEGTHKRHSRKRLPHQSNSGRGDWFPPEKESPAEAGQVHPGRKDEA